MPDGQSPASATESHLSALVSIIAQATKVVESYYAKSSDRPFPSLDDVEPHPMDNELHNLELRNAIATVEGACAQLAANIGRPSSITWNRSSSFFESSCIHVVTTQKIPDLLVNKLAGMHISEISKATGMEERKLSRVLRLLASKHIFREVSENVFANNRLSMQLVSSNPVSSLCVHLTDEGQKAGAVLTDVLTDKDWGHSYNAAHSAFNKFSGSPDSIYLYYEKPEGAERGARLGVGLIGWSSIAQTESVIVEFPWGELPEGTTICDVGGGVGTACMQLSKRYPNLKFVLQDLPERIEQAKTQVWPAKCPEAIAENRIQFVPFDFFAGPPVAGCDIYFVKAVIHNWADEECVKILSNVKKAMAPHSRIIIEDYILQPACRVPDDDSPFQQAPEPMLPNYGAGRIRQYLMDLHMMSVFNSMERRLSQFIDLGNAAGLKFVKLWNVGETRLVEFQLP